MCRLGTFPFPHWAAAIPDVFAGLAGKPLRPFAQVAELPDDRFGQPLSQLDPCASSFRPAQPRPAPYRGRWTWRSARSGRTPTRGADDRRQLGPHRGRLADVGAFEGHPKPRTDCRPARGGHINTAEAGISTLRRTPLGMYHTRPATHLQRYADDVVWRRNHRKPTGEKIVQKVGPCDRMRTRTTTILKPVPVVEQIRALPQGAVRQSARYRRGRP